MNAYRVLKVGGSFYRNALYAYALPCLKEKMQEEKKSDLISRVISYLQLVLR